MPEGVDRSGDEAVAQGEHLSAGVEQYTDVKLSPAFAWRWRRWRRSSLDTELDATFTSMPTTRPSWCSITASTSSPSGSVVVEAGV